MGWDTQINIIVENIIDEEIEIAKFICENDRYGDPIIQYKEQSNSKILFISYERRKIIPYFIIEEISETYNDKHFTAIGSSPCWVGGPCGLMKFENGKVIDSYSFSDRGINIDITEILEEPRAELIYKFFGKNQLEDEFRKFKKNKPKNFSIDNLEKYHVEFTEYENSKFDEIESNCGLGNWKEITTYNKV